MKTTQHLLKVTIVFLLFVGLTSLTNILKPEQALLKLKEGNLRFVNGERAFPNQNDIALKTTNEKGQFPFATIISCSDSRVPVEHIFDAGFGDIFVIRVAGNVVNVDEAGSIEYGVEHLHTPVLVVLGHTSCGAVTAVCRGDEVHGNIPKLVENIVPAVNKAKETHGHEFRPDLVEHSIVNNVWQSIEDLMKISPITAELVQNGKLIVVGAIYHLDTGIVDWLGEHPEMAKLIETKNHTH